MATITIYQVPITLYWDSDRAIADNKYQSSTVRQAGTYTVVNQRTSGGLTVYGINDLTNSYAIGWVRGDQVGQAGEQMTEPVYHTVKSGEYLWLIAQMYGTTVEQIKALNGLTSNVIRSGQVLLVKQGTTKTITETETGEIVEEVPAFMELEVDGRIIKLHEGTNLGADLVLHKGVNTIKVRGNGKIKFRFNHEVMG